MAKVADGRVLLESSNSFKFAGRFERPLEGEYYLGLDNEIYQAGKDFPLPTAEKQDKRPRWQNRRPILVRATPGPQDDFVSSED